MGRLTQSYRQWIWWDPKEEWGCLWRVLMSWRLCWQVQRNLEGTLLSYTWAEPEPGMILIHWVNSVLWLSCNKVNGQSGSTSRGFRLQNCDHQWVRMVQARHIKIPRHTSILRLLMVLKNSISTKFLQMERFHIDAVAIVLDAESAFMWTMGEFVPMRRKGNRFDGN